MNKRNDRALVTGASRGIGLAISEALTEKGYDLLITARDDKALRKVKSDLMSKGARVECWAADLMVASEIESMFKKAIEFLGGIDILINNAGIGVKSKVVDLGIEDWDRMHATNLKAPFLLSKLAAREMIPQGHGHIINIGSGASQTPIAEQAGYCATKFGLLGFSESLALELREHGIKVSIVLPGSTATYFGGSTPEKKSASMPGILHAGDVADAVLYLLKQKEPAWTSVLNLRPLNPKKT